ncbi:MAG: ABC transporter permease [Candidatus Aphodosoma sp.]
MRWFDLDSFQEIVITITRNKWRSFFTAFGVFWGVFMLVVLLGIGTGFRNFFMNSLDGMATNSLYIMANTTSEPYKGFQSNRNWSLHTKDLNIISNRVKGIKDISPFVWLQYSNQVVRNTKNGNYNIMGYAPSYINIFPHKIVKGRYINDIDIKECRKVCVIGRKVQNDLYNQDEDVIGSIIKIGGVYYRVIGIVEDKSDNINMFGRLERMVMLPYTTLQQANNIGDVIHGLSISFDDKYDIKQKEEEVRSVISEINMISPTDKNAIGCFNIKEIFDTFSIFSLGLIVLIWIVGAGTLMAGVVGVSNIMLVTVKERTQEIGVRRALGATSATIIKQILGESILLTSLAGSVGLMFGVAVLSVVDSLLLGSADVPLESPQIPFTIALVALVIIILFGLLAGYLPAKRALSIKAIEALQEE